MKKIISDIINKLNEDKVLESLILNIYDDKSLIKNFYIDTYYTKEMIIDNLISNLVNPKLKFDKLRLKLANDCISFCESKGILDIKSEFKLNLQKVGINPVSSYVYSVVKEYNKTFYYNIYLEYIKSMQKLDDSIKRYHNKKDSEFSNTVAMYLEYIEYVKKIEKELEEYKKENKELKEILDNIKLTDIDLDIEIDFDDKIKPREKGKKIVRVGGYKSVTDENVEYISVEDAVRYRDKIKNADLVIYDTKRNSHSVFFMVKKLNKNIIKK
ncbi:hypothetical protein [Oceanivirga miroungae]|uniref:Uncharacterized protein n=1 Tax=Oceanivirga miroungae TaxID=1130046 RepID=A0A6I8M701_9FUSO|nr:hypothetical protein [Oceanivirga miroungae]VWL85643.1 hypothetical protein OMES3154_00928 [Oceanivirga miroungae]